MRKVKDFLWTILYMAMSINTCERRRLGYSHRLADDHNWKVWEGAVLIWKEYRRVS